MSLEEESSSPEVLLSSCNTPFISHHENESLMEWERRLCSKEMELKALERALMSKQKLLSSREETLKITTETHNRVLSPPHSAELTHIELLWKHFGNPKLDLG